MGGALDRRGPVIVPKSLAFLLVPFAIIATALTGTVLAKDGRAAAPVADPVENRSGSKVAHFTLGNGLEVVVIPDRRVPVVTHMIWYKVGAADEPPGKS